MTQHTDPSHITFPLLSQLVSSVAEEEKIIEQLLASLSANKPAAVVKAARDLAALRAAPLVDNCAE